MPFSSAGLAPAFALEFIKINGLKRLSPQKTACYAMPSRLVTKQREIPIIYGFRLRKRKLMKKVPIGKIGFKKPSFFVFLGFSLERARSIKKKHLWTW